jgi:hypothetical protein
MMVVARVGVEARGGRKMVGLARHSQLDQGFQHAIDRGPRNARDPILHVGKELVDRRMIVAVDQSFENNPPLHGDGKPLLTAHLFQLFEFFSLNL